MYCDEILVGTNEVLVNTYLKEVHSNLLLVFDELGLVIESNHRMLEFIPYSNILNVVNLSNEDSTVVSVTYETY